MPPATRRPDLDDLTVFLVGRNPNSNAAQITRLAESWATAKDLLITPPRMPWGALGLALARLDFTSSISSQVFQALSHGVTNGYLDYADDASYSITREGLAHLPLVRLG
jgi:hypothetical protein